jgi:hypothetical protein
MNERRLEFSEANDRSRNDEEDRIESPLSNPKEAYYIFKAMRLDSFEGAMDALDEFVVNLEMVDPDMTFERGSAVLARAAEGFGTIDKNHDLMLTREELGSYVNRTEGEIDEGLEWLHTHFDSLSRASLFPEGQDGISRMDLESASRVFSGLAHVQRNFGSIATSRDNDDHEISIGDLYSYVHNNESDLPADDKLAIYDLVNYIKRLETKSGQHGLSQNALAELSPEDLWPRDSSSA